MRLLSWGISRLEMCLDVLSVNMMPCCFNTEGVSGKKKNKTFPRSILFLSKYIKSFVAVEEWSSEPLNFLDLALAETRNHFPESHKRVV